MNNRIQSKYVAALQQCSDLHANNVNQDYLPVFKRAAKERPEGLEMVVKMYKKAIAIHRSNLIPALYDLVELADVSPESKTIIIKHFPLEEIEYYISDIDDSVASNARILKKVLNGSPLSNFSKKEANNKTDIHIGDTIKGDKIGDINASRNANILIKSSKTSISQLKIEILEQEIEQNYTDSDKEELQKKIHEIKNIEINSENKPKNSSLSSK